jgi:16S rRNA processing protein RimM
MAAARRSQLEVGAVDRPHGLAGAVVVHLVTDQLERLAPGATLDTDTGVLTVRAARPLKGRFVVTFEGIDTLEAAESLRGAVLRSEPLDKEGALWVDELIGATVRTTDGAALGTVVGVEANPASDLLVLDSGGLVPTRFVVGQVVGGAITVEVPEGLL